VLRRQIDVCIRIEPRKRPARHDTAEPGVYIQTCLLRWLLVECVQASTPLNRDGGLLESMAGPDCHRLHGGNLVMACRTGAARYCSIRRRAEAGASSMSPMKSPFFPFDSSVHGRTGTLFMANARLSPSPSGRGHGRQERGRALVLSVSAQPHSGHP